MAHARQRDMEAADAHNDETEPFSGRRQRPAAPAHPGGMSPLPLLLAGGFILILCLVAVDKIWEVSSFHTSHSS